MINGTIKDYTITTLQNILGILVIQLGTQTNELKVLHGMTLHIHELNHLDIHISNGLYIKSLKTNWYYSYYSHYPQQKRREPFTTMVTYFTSVHPDDIHKDIKNLTKQTLWEIITRLSE